MKPVYVVIFFMLCTTHAYSETLEVDTYMTPLIEFSIFEKGKEKEVDTQFLKAVREWHDYQSRLENMKPSIIVNHHRGDGDRRYYFDNNQNNYKSIYTVTFKDGKTIKQTIYYKNHSVYLVLHDLNNDLVVDIIQYFENGEVMFHQRTYDGKNDSGFWY